MGNNKSKKNKKKKKSRLLKYIKGCLCVFAILSVFGTIGLTYLLSDTRTMQFPEPTSSFYIADYSGVFTEDTENYILEQAVALNQETKAQVVVVAIPETQDKSLEGYSYQLANNWKIGDEERDNGVLILFTTKEPHVRLEIGKGLEGCLSDAKSGRILDEWAVDAQDNGRWNEAARNTFTAVAKEVYAEYGKESPSSLTTVDATEESVSGATMADAVFPEVIIEKSKEPLWMQIIASFIVFLIVAFSPYVILCAIIYCAANSKDSYTGGSYYSDSSGGSGGGGYSGGGGSFGGGGASR